jgi:hypothetical protein
MRICVITSYYCKVVVGLGAQLCTLLEVWDSGSRDVDAWRANVSVHEDRGIQEPMALEDGNIMGTQCCDTLSCAS